MASTAQRDEGDPMWLQLEVGTARSVSRRARTPIDVPTSGHPRGAGRRALVVESAHTYLPEAAIDSLPALARDEVQAGLKGRLRLMIAETEPDDPTLLLLRDELVGRLGGTADTTGALTVLDMIYARRLLRHQVPAVVSASCVAWYGHSRVSNRQPPLTATGSWGSWIAKPRQRPECESAILTAVGQLAGTGLTALEDADV